MVEIACILQSIRGRAQIAPALGNHIHRLIYGVKAEVLRSDIQIGDSQSLQRGILHLNMHVRAVRRSCNRHIRHAAVQKLLLIKAGISCKPFYTLLELIYLLLVNLLIRIGIDAVHGFYGKLPDSLQII